MFVLKNQNNKGQVLALFILLLPIIMMGIGLVIDVGFLYLEKRQVDNALKEAIEYGLENIENITETELNNLLYKNIDNIDNIKITIRGNIIEILVEKKKDSLFAFLFGKDSYEIISSYQGKIENGTIKIVRE